MVVTLITTLVNRPHQVPCHSGYDAFSQGRRHDYSITLQGLRYLCTLAKHLIVAVSVITEQIFCGCRSMSVKVNVNYSKACEIFPAQSIC